MREPSFESRRRIAEIEGRSGGGLLLRREDMVGRGREGEGMGLCLGACLGACLGVCVLWCVV